MEPNIRQRHNEIELHRIVAQPVKWRADEGVRREISLHAIRYSRTPPTRIRQPHHRITFCLEVVMVVAFNYVKRERFPGVVTHLVEGHASAYFPQLVSVLLLWD